MDFQQAIKVIKECQVFANQCSMANDPHVKVASIKTLVDMLSRKLPDDLIQILTEYGTLDGFITNAKLELNHDDVQLMFDWDFQVMTQTLYQEKRLPAINHDGTSLFVIDKHHVGGLVTSAPQVYQSDLEKEIIQLTESLAITPESYVIRAEIRKKIGTMLNKVWRNKDLRVSTFGSTSTGLATADADIDLCISGPVLGSDYHGGSLQRVAGSVYNMNFLASKLREIGMDHVIAINEATVPICKFRDPEFNLYCDINTNNLMGIENTNLIIQYMHLDSRVRPFLFALKLFIKTKEINNSQKGFMCSYTFILMGLHFLMFVQNPPVIPCLQELRNATCTSADCNSRQRRRVADHLVAYHDCVRVVNTVTDLYNSKTTSPETNPTIWYGRNSKNVGDLVLELFTWMSQTSNLLKPMSLATSARVGRLSGWRKHDAVFPDPFVSTRNVAGSCTAIGAKVICQEFRQACNKLNQGLTFKDTLSKNDLVYRPVDPKSMNYRFGHRS
ncbi:uncharacterized protein EV154DRAFT_604313 [Mucor mucedo]|uniref:uncharacterized protein n=1 Tax=Mucor mucedo TaxID=29922 RepID=UPI002220A303|nr:uncharacterized protein EV154DRAFT_604313 [Mucor mucedo]KAI7889061.1 hypothetical protein EV154DRAFT_604313 [Mucor mucedo]